MARSDPDPFRIDIDLDHARREGERVRDLLAALRRRHDLARYEYTTLVRIVPGGDTFAQPILTLSNRFAESEDTLLSTYLHEQMHWYLWYLGTPERDMVAPFMDELVRRYPQAPTEPPDGARGYDATYLHLVVNWLEIAATSEFVGRERAFAVGRAQRSYRWIYRTVLKDWDLLGSSTSATTSCPFGTPRSCVRRALAPRSGLSTAARKELLQQTRAPCLSDPAVDLRRVVARGLAEDARPVLDPAALGIAGAEVEAADAGERDGRRAHRAGLQRDVEVGARQPLGLHRRAGRADRQHLGVRGGIVELACAVAGSCEDSCRRRRR